MDLNVGKEVAAMQRMTIGELRGKYAEVFGEPTNADAETADRLQPRPTMEFIT